MSLQRFLKTVVSGLRTDRRRKQASGVSRMEWLESRALLAGNVLVTLQDGLARITGDNNDNAVEVVASGSSVVVRGLNGTTINSGASAFTLATSSTTFPGSLVAMLGAGNDSISVRSGVTISGTTRLNGEAGNDALAVSGTLTGRVALNAGAGTDSIAVLNVTAPGGLRLDSSGTAVIAISGSTIGSALDISTGNGSDEIVVTGTTVNGHTSIVTRNGNDDIVLKNSTLRGRFYLSADRGDDVAIIDSTTIERESHLWMREGEDAVQVQGTSVLSSKFFVGQLLGQNATEIKLPATVSRLRQVGRPSNNVSDSLVEERITSPTTGAIARTDAVLAAATPTLTMVIAATSIAENGGAAATTAVITRSGSTNADLIVNLSSSNEARAKFASATATIPSGQISVTVNVSAVDNTTAESEATVTLTAAATGFISGTDTVVVTSDEIAALTVTAAQSTFAENAAEAARTFTVSRNTTDKSTAVTVNLASNTTSRLTVPASVTIPANASSVTFVATTVNNTTVDANVDVVITASAAGLASGTVTVTVTDDDSPALSLSATPSAVLENAGTGAVTLTVSRSATDNTASLVVNLSSGSSRLTVPASVIIPAGQASTTFTATPTNDSVFSGQTSVVVTATAAGLTTGTGTVIINDDESAALSLTSSVTTVSESAASPAVTYTVSRNTADTTSAVVVTLTSSDTARLTVPGTVTIPAGQSSVTFVGTPVNNTAADGSQLVTVTASLTGFSTAQASVTVTDDDGANLSLSANPVSVAENAGDDTITFTVTRNAGPITNALTVNLTSGTAGRLTVPPTVTIPAGAASVTVAGTPVNNSNDDGDAVVLITAAATGLAAATTNVTVTDDDIPSLTITASPAGVAENAGSNAVTYTVSRNTSDNSAGLVVRLSDGGSSRLDIPSTVTIPAGAASVTVQATPVNNTLDDGDVSVTVTATATGFAPDDVAVSITDDDAAALTLTVS
ncbi:MAG: beta strand repeat-containing protein, partial [Planctomycetota bacterium]